jgi:hypothetical protein
MKLKGKKTSTKVLRIKLEIKKKMRNKMKNQTYEKLQLED